jgi:hypothetical protein
MTVILALAAVKRQSALIGQYMTDAEVTAAINDFTGSAVDVLAADIPSIAIGCLQYARGLIPTSKSIGNISLAYEAVDVSIAAIDPGGNIPLTRPVFELGEQEV